MVVNVNLNNNIINYNCPDSSSDENFDSKSYTNPKQAAVYIPVLDTKNININNNIFNCTFDVVTQNRFPFVSFDFNQYSNAYLYNVNIENNYFNDYFVSADGDKYTSVICFVVTSTISNVIDNNHIINTNIKGNICNKNQQICIGALYTTPTQTSYPTFSPSLLNVFIENNICGLYLLNQQSKPYNLQ